MRTPICLPDLCPEINAEHRNLVSTSIGILVFSHLCLNDIFLQEGRQESLHYTLVFHKIFEDDVIYRIGYVQHILSFRYIDIFFIMLANILRKLHFSKHLVLKRIKSKSPYT